MPTNLFKRSLFVLRIVSFMCIWAVIFILTNDFFQDVLETFAHIVLAQIVVSWMFFVLINEGREGSYKATHLEIRFSEFLLAPILTAAVGCIVFLLLSVTGLFLQSYDSFCVALLLGFYAIGVFEISKVAFPPAMDGEVTI